MHILQLCNKVPLPPIDGGAIATLNLTKGFSKLGHKVTMLALNTSKHYYDMSHIPDDIQKTVDIIGIDVDTRIHPHDAFKNLFFSRLPYNAERFVSDDFEKKLVSLLEQNKYDVIQLEGLYMGLYIEVIREHSSAIIAMRAHNIEHEIWERTARQEEKLWKKMYTEILAKRIKRLKLQILNKYDVLIPITQRDADFYKEFGNRTPVHVSPSGVDYTVLKPDNSDMEYPSVFHIGAMDWGPNQEGLIWFLEKIWPPLSTKFPELKFYVAGRNAPEWLEKKFNHQNIVYLGEIENAYSFMNSKAIMVVPLFSGSGMRVKIIEGMALGKTIISTSIGAEGIECIHNYNIIIADKTNEFLKAIEKCITNRSFFENIGKNAITFVRENFDNVKISAGLINFYKKFKK